MWAFIAGCSTGIFVGFLLAQQASLYDRDRYDGITQQPQIHPEEDDEAPEQDDK